MTPSADRQPDQLENQPPGMAAYVALALLVVSGVTALHAMHVGWSHLW